jgi:ribonuclease H2 subunit A
VSRDHALKIWTFREGIEVPSEGFGSGYPGDPVTKRILKNFEPSFGFSRIVRFSWSTASNALDENHAYCVEFEEEEEQSEKKVKLASKND